MADVVDQVMNYNIGGALTGWLQSSFWYLVYGALGIGGLAMILNYIRNKQIYKFKVRVRRRRGTAAPEEGIYKAGYITDKNGFQTFRIKTGRWPWQKKDLDKLPDTRWIDGITFHYQQKDPQTWIQTRVIHLERQLIKRKLVLLQDYGGFAAGTEGTQFQDVAERMVQEGIAEYSDEGEPQVIPVEDEVYEPIPSDHKAITITKLQTARAALGLDSTKQVAIFTIGIIVLAAMFLIGYYFMTSKGGTA